jgi:hypothetical protein
MSGKAVMGESNIKFSNAVVNDFVRIVSNEISEKENVLSSPTHKKCMDIKTYARDRRVECEKLILEVNKLLVYFDNQKNMSETQEARKKELMQFRGVFIRAIKSLNRLTFLASKAKEKVKISKEQEAALEKAGSSSFNNAGTLSTALHDALTKMY